MKATVLTVLHVETLSDNRNRTGAEIRSTFTKAGGSLAEPGAVAWQFDRLGVIEVPKESTTEEALMESALELGAQDIKDGENNFEVITPATDLFSIKNSLADLGVQVGSSDLTMLPNTIVDISDPEHAKSVVKIIEALDSHDDVQNVFANCHIPDEIMQSLV